MSAIYTILCEDAQTDVFVRQFLSLRHGIGRRKRREYFETLPFPRGAGAGEQWVRENFPKELGIIRRRQARQSGACLVVAIDADRHTTDERLRQLHAACREQKIDEPVPDDPVLIAIPRRNIETWLAYLRGEEVDEAKIYRKYDCESECKPQAEELHRMCHREHRLRQPAPPSLVEACRRYPGTVES